MEIAVVGGGLFGITSALRLDSLGHEVELFEQADEIFTGASWTNQLRLHRGYHYPRSPDTTATCKQSAEQFQSRFPEAVVESTEHYYCIAEERTKTSAQEFIDHCERFDLEYERSHPPVVETDPVQLSLRVKENRIDHERLKGRCERDLERSGVELRFGHRVESLSELDHDVKVLATYAGVNQLLDQYPNLQARLKYQLCEKPVVRLPDRFEGLSVVIMDGPFMCFDPYGRTEKFLLGNVVHAVHETKVGLRPSFDSKYDSLLDSGLIRSPPITKFDDFIESGSEFIPGLAEADHIGSLYTIRAVPAGVEETDKRPTVVQREDDVIKLFSGKLASAIPASKQVAEYVEF